MQFPAHHSISANPSIIHSAKRGFDQGRSRLLHRRRWEGSKSLALPFWRYQSQISTAIRGRMHSSSGSGRRRQGSAKHSKGGGSGEDRRGGESGGHGRSSEARPPSPGEVLQEAQQMLRNLQAQSRQYRDEYDRNAREATRLDIMLAEFEGERALLATSAAAARAAREGRMIDQVELTSRRNDMDREIQALRASIVYYRRASESMNRLLASVEEEIARLDRDVQNLRSGQPLGEDNSSYYY